MKREEILEHYRKSQPIMENWADDDNDSCLGQTFRVRGGMNTRIVMAEICGDHLSKKAASGSRSIYGIINFINPAAGFIQKKENEDISFVTH